MGQRHSYLQNMQGVPGVPGVVGVVGVEGVPGVGGLQDLGFNLQGSVGGLNFAASKLQDLDTYKINVAGNFDNSAPIGGKFIQGNTRLLQNLDTYSIKVAGNFDNSAPIGGKFIQGNTGRR